DGDGGGLLTQQGRQQRGDAFSSIVSPEFARLAQMRATTQQDDAADAGEECCQLSQMESLLKDCGVPETELSRTLFLFGAAGAEDPPNSSVGTAGRRLLAFVQHRLTEYLERTSEEEKDPSRRGTGVRSFALFLRSDLEKLPLIVRSILYCTAVASGDNFGLTEDAGCDPHASDEQKES
ncbi:unnamed protein product, partial [Amoebophrya sp. A25]